MKVKLGDVCEIVNGKSQKKVENPNGKYPIYGSGGIIGYADDYICEANTVVIGRKGSINNPIFVEQSFWNVDTAFGLCANPVKLLPKYLYYFCEKYDFEKLNTTVTIPSLTKTNLLNIKISLPPLDEQHHIAAVLDKVSDLIALRKKQLVKLDELVKARFVELFGDLTVNTFRWNFIPLSELCDVRDGTHDSPKYVDYGYPLLTSKNFTSGIIDFTDCNMISKEDFDKINLRSKVDIGDIIMPMIGTIGNPIIVKTDKLFAIKNVALIKFKDNKISNIFIKEILNSCYFYYITMVSNRGGTQKFIALGDIRKLPIPVVSLDLQQQFADFVEQIDKQKAIIQRSLDKLEMLKKSLMQEYFG